MISELWIIRGNRPVLWTIPMYAKHVTGYEVELVTAVPILKLHERALRARVEEVGRIANGIYYVAIQKLREIAKAVPSQDPELLFSWNTLRADQRQYAEKFNNPDQIDFLDRMFQNGIGKTRDEVTWWWYQFCNHALETLVAHEKPVDMFFCRLHPSPYRSDWRQQFMGKMFNHVKQHGKTAEDIASDPKFRQLFESPTLASFFPDQKVLERRIEVEMKPEWWSNILHVEKTRRSELLSREQYVQAYEDSCRRFAKAAATLFADWMEGAHHDCARIAGSGVSGRFLVRSSKTGTSSKRNGARRRDRVGRLRAEVALARAEADAARRKLEASIENWSV